MGLNDTHCCAPFEVLDPTPHPLPRKTQSLQMIMQICRQSPSNCPTWDQARPQKGSMGPARIRARGVLGRGRGSEGGVGFVGGGGSGVVRGGAQGP